MVMLRKLSILILLLCVLMSLKNHNAETKTGSYSTPKHRLLEYDYYRDSCPLAEKIIRQLLRRMHQARPDIAPALLRLVFHDCFVEGCDASVLLDPDDTDEESEKDAPPNETLKGFDVIDIIKSAVEGFCPGIVSCADILVLAAREAVVLAGGPFYPLLTGRRDSKVSYPEIAAYELPSPQDDLLSTIETFGSRGFDEREAVTLLGGHSIGTMHCKFFHNRLYKFGGTNKPDPSLDSEFLREMRSICSRTKTTSSSHSPPVSPSSQPPQFSSFVAKSPLSSSLYNLPAASSSSSFESLSFLPKDSCLGYEGQGQNFGTLYYRNLLQKKGILYADQQLTAGEETRNWVTAYATDALLFRQDFAMAMMKLSNLSVLTSPQGVIRRHCAKAV